MDSENVEWKAKYEALHAEFQAYVDNQVAEAKKIKEYHKYVESQTAIIDKTPAQKMDDLSKVMLMMRQDLIGTVESLRKHPHLSVHMIPNKSKVYNSGVNDSVKAIHYYYQGIFAKAVENIVEVDKTSDVQTEAERPAETKDESN